jgi:hypothetical protein
MNLNNIFVNNLIQLNSKFDYIYSLEIKWVLKWFKKITKLEPFTLNQLELIKDKLNFLNLEYIYFEKDEYFDDEKMLFLKWKNGEEKYIDIYISRSKKTLNILENILNTEKNIIKKNFLIWKLLWYPDCCIKSFLESNYTWDISFNLKVKENTTWKFDWRLNNLINPYSLIPFFPCTYNCKEAVKYAENNLDIIWNREEIEEIFKNVIEYNNFWDIKILKWDLSEWKNIFNFLD